MPQNEKYGTTLECQNKEWNFFVEDKLKLKEMEFPGIPP